jgi:homoserine kinase type II
MSPTAPNVADRTGRPLPLGELARLWPLGGWLVVTPVSGGKNDHFRLRARDGEFFLRRSHRAKPRSELVAQLSLVRLLSERGLPVPVAVESRDGADHALVEGRLWTMTAALEGHRYDDTSQVHLRLLGDVLARYHRLTEDLDGGEGPPAVVVDLEARASVLGVPPPLLRSLERVVDRLRALAPDLPRAMVHGGARRGSLLFDDHHVVGVLDFDSARPDIRVMDLATAVHDVGKVYTDPAYPDHKLRLELGRVRALLRAYAAVMPLQPAEAAALPLLLEARRLRRMLGRLERSWSGEALSDNDRAKIVLEQRRLTWLAEHRLELAAACGVGTG